MRLLKNPNSSSSRGQGGAPLILIVLLLVNAGFLLVLFTGRGATTTTTTSTTTIAKCIIQQPQQLEQIKNVTTTTVSSGRLRSTNPPSYAPTTTAPTTALPTALPTTLSPTTVEKYLPAHFFCLCPTRKDEKSCNPELCDTIITYKEEEETEEDDSSNHTAAVFNLPSSTWTTARNAMYHLAKQQVQHQQQLTQQSGGAELPSHFCFMDGDVKINKPKQFLIQQLRNETERNKIVVLNYRGAFTGAHYLWCADANLNCFPSTTMDQFLPYSTLRDDQAWFLSQSDLIMRANLMVEPFVFKMYDNIKLFNPMHNEEYPRNGTEGFQQLYESYRRMGYTKGCFPHGNPTAQEDGPIHTCTLELESPSQEKEGKGGDDKGKGQSQEHNNKRFIFEITFNDTHRTWWGNR